MRLGITQEQRERLLKRAVAAVKARLAVGPDTDLREVSADHASRTVTEAVTVGDHLHTQIAQLAGCSGLQVINLITDWDARGRALGVERNALKTYEGQVREAAQQYAAQRVGAFGRSEELIQKIAAGVGVTRAVVYNWIKPGVSDS